MAAKVWGMDLSDDELAEIDEFSLLEIYATREGIAWSGQPRVRRVSFDGSSCDVVSAVVWGEDDPEIVLLHGAGQNAHTWDSLALALNRPLVAIDLPGHGRSSWRSDRDYSPWANARELAPVIEQLAPRARAVIGMSLGALSSMALAGLVPQLVKRLVLVDATPAMGGRRRQLTEQELETVALIGKTPTFSTFKEMLDATAAAAPGRSLDSLIPGVLHNSTRLADGSWRWRYDRIFDPSVPRRAMSDLWDDLLGLSCPVMLVRGGRSAFVSAEDVEEFARRVPDARVEVVPDAGHSVQSSHPILLASLIDDFVSDSL